MFLMIMKIIVALTMIALFGSSSPSPPPPPHMSKSIEDVLMDFKHAITNDPQNSLASWNLDPPTNPCTWNGIFCRPNTTQIKGISLSNMSLQGSITPSLHYLPHLSYLDLSLNNISDSIPPLLPSTLSHINFSHNALLGTFSSSTFSNLSRLTSLALDNNKLEGSITPFLSTQFPRLTTLTMSVNNLSGILPMEIGQMALLKVLDLSTNHLSGTLPTTLGNLTALRSLHLGGNPFHGPIPASLGNCSRLETLELGLNNISGTIPPELGLGCRNLKYLSFWMSTLSGPMPPEIGHCSQLEFINLEGNKLEGRVIDILANCSHLETIGVVNNSFVGNLPPHMGNLFPKLKAFNIMFNNFSGPIPASLGNCSNLDTLTLGFNQFSGEIPKEIFQLRNLTYLDMQNCFLSGSIPPEIGNLTSVVRIIVNNNQLTGWFPRELGTLAVLEGLTVENNLLAGNIPEELANCSQLVSLNLNHNYLEGSIPSSFGILGKFLRLFAHDNRLAGPIPPTLSNCTTISTLILNNNFLSGQIPSSFSSLRMLTETSLAHNLMSGPIPSSLFIGMAQISRLDLSANNFSNFAPISLENCVELIYLNLSQNSITGIIPENWGSLKGLAQLDLSSNSFSGQIPISLTKIPDLAFANFSYNELEGSIPSGGSFKNKTIASFLGNPRLCGPIVNRSCNSTPHSNHVGLSKKEKIAVIVGATVILVLICIISFITYAKGWCLWSKWSDPRIVRWDLGDKLNPDFVKVGVEEIQEATYDFSEDNILGSGGTGIVYKGVMKDGKTLAFKKLLLADTSLRSFIAELRSVGSIRHRNLVKILGYCYNLDSNIIVLEYMPNGNLDTHLHPQDNCKLMSWPTRLNVALGIAHGLTYLHYDSHVHVVHCDIKPNNILLDEDMEPRIADFGLAKLIHNTLSVDSSSSAQNILQGSLGYVAPEYASFGQISRKCDVYSYGILLMEMVSGRRPTDIIFGEAGTIVGWVRSMLAIDETMSIMDQRLLHEDDHVDEHNIKYLLKLALACTKENPKDRPTMQEVVQLLQDGLFHGQEEIQQASLTIKELALLK